MANWVTTAEVKTKSQVNDHEMLGFTVVEDYNTWIDDTLLPECESVINDYCGTTFTDVTAGNTVKLVCGLLAGKIIQHIINNAKSPIVRVAEYNLQVATVSVFTKDLKDLLNPHRVNKFVHAVTDYQIDKMKDAWDE